MNPFHGIPAFAGMTRNSIYDDQGINYFPQLPPFVSALTSINILMNRRVRGYGDNRRDIRDK